MKTPKSGKAKRPESGFDTYLYETLTEDREATALFFQEVDKTPEPSRSRLLRGRLKKIRELHNL